jgi:hypothetical protein
MLKELAFEYAECNEISHRFNRAKKTAGKKWEISFCKTQNLSVRLPEECSLGRTTGFNEVQVNRFSDNLRAVFEKHNFPPNIIFNMDESGISTVSNKLPKLMAEKGKNLWVKLCPQIVGNWYLLFVASALQVSMFLQLYFPVKECAMNCILKLPLELYL